MDVWKTTAWITALCALPYFIYYATYSFVNWSPFASAMVVLVLAAVLGWITMYYVLLKATKLPKKTS